MTEAKAHEHFRAVRMLVFATLFWGISFPVARAMHLLQAELLPGVDSWFTTGLGMVMRFALAGLALGWMARRSLRSITRSEWREGLLLGFFCGAGSLLQMDGMAYTDASTSAFLTQSYCVMVPFLVCLRDRALPSARLAGCCLLMLVGITILTPGVNFSSFRLGRGELETLLGALLFSGQILCLEHPRFQANRPENFSAVMVWVIFAISLLPAIWHTDNLGDWVVFALHPGMVGLVLILVFACTVAAYLLMNRYQPKVTSTEATLIYGFEPVWASLFALFVPGIISICIGVAYANERLTWNLVLGGGTICAANLFLQWDWFDRRRKSKPTPAVPTPAPVVGDLNGPSHPS